MAGEPICLDAGASTTRRLLQVSTPKAGRTTAPGVAEGGLRLRGLVKEDAPGLPLISVLTVVRNSQETLEQTLRSVLDQDYPNVEYLVVDGVSNDGTLEIVRRYQEQLDYWLSEPDGGIAEAMNKAIGLARGTLIQLLNADDYLEPGALSAVAQRYCQVESPCVVYGHYTMLEAGLGTRKPLRSSLDAHQGMSICHQAMFVHRGLYEQWGRFDVSLAIAFDYAWFLRVLHAGVRFVCVEQSLVTYRDVGASSTRLWRCAVEADRIHRQYYSDRRVRAQYLLRTGKHLLVAGLKQQLYARLGETVTNQLRWGYRRLKQVLWRKERR